MLPDAIEGEQAPVVQTRYKQTMIPCSTYLVQPGWFDIFFPTNFEKLARLYERICGKQGQIFSQRSFLQNWAQLDATKTRSGENPMLSFYENMKFFVS